MSRIGRTFPPQIGIPNQFGITQHALGPRAPQQQIPPLTSGLLQVYPATGLLTNQRRAQQRRTSYDLRPPTVLRAPFVAAPINVNTAADLLRRRYASTRRFPLQGWQETPVLSRTTSLVVEANKPAATSQETDVLLGYSTTPSPDLWLTVVMAFDAGAINDQDSIAQLAVNFGISPSPTGWSTFHGTTTTASPPQPNTFYTFELHATATNQEVYLNGSLILTDAAFAIGLIQPKFGLTGNGTVAAKAWVRSASLGTSRGAGDIYSRDYTAGATLPSGIETIRGNTSLVDSGTTPVPFGPTSLIQVMTARRLGPQPPLLIAPRALAVSLAVYPATGLLTNQRRNTQRRTMHELFGFIPQVSAQPPPPISVNLASRTRPRPRTAYVDGPVLVAPAAPVVTTLNVNVASGLLTRQRRAQQRRTDYLLAPPAVAAAGFVAPPISVNLQPDRLSRRFRRQLPSSVIAPPTVLAPVSTKITVLNVALGRARSSTKRFPLQGWNETPAEMQAPSGAWEAAITAAAPDAWWRLGDSGTAVDRVGGRNLTYNAAVVTGQEGLPVASADGSAQFPGTSGGIASAAGLTPLLLGQTDWTVELWYAGRGQITSFFKEQGSGNDRIDVQGSSASGPVVVVIRDAGTIDVNNIFTPVTPMADGARRHVVFVKSGTTITVFVDGVAGTPQTFTFGPQTDPTSTISIGTSTKAWVDEMVVYRRALSTAEAQAHYTAGAVGPPPPLVYVQRFLGPRAPRLIFAIAPTIKIEPPTVALATRQNPNLRRTHSFLTVPQFLAQPPPFAPVSVNTATGVLTNWRRAQQRRTSYRLAPPVFYPATSEIAVALVRARPRPTSKLLGAPATLQPYSITLAEDTIRVALVRTRPRRTTAFLGDYIVAPVVAAFYGPATHLVRARPRPTVLSLTAVSYPATSRIAVSLVRTRPRPTRGVLAAPPPLTVFAGPKVTLVRTRPRLTHARLAAPTVIRVPSVEQAEQTIRVSLVRARPRPTRARLAPPQALQVFTGPTVRLVITRPRPTTTLLPGYVVAPVQAAFYGPVVKLVRARPRPTAHRLTAVTYPATSQIEARLVATRPRPIRSRLAPPATLEPAAVAQAERTIRVTLVRTRPRPTVRELAPPATLEPESVALHERQILVSLARTRPRPTKALLPGYIVAPVAAAFYGPQVELARIRPRPIRSRLAPPVTYPATSEILVALVRTRPRPTARLLFAPAAIRIPAVEQREQTITVTLVRTRPRPTVRLLAAPQALAVFAGPRVSLVRTRPRPTVWTVRAPRVIRVPQVEQAEQTIRVTLVRARPRPTTTVLAAPTVVRVPSVEQREQTVAVALVRTRPRLTHARLAAPTVIVTNPPLVTTLLPAKLQAIRGRLLHRPTHWRLAPPTAVIPLPGLRQQTITVRLVATRPRPTTTLLTPPTRLFPPQLLQRLSTIGVTLVRTRPRPTVRLLTGPSFPRPSLDQQTIGVTLTRIRPPRTSSRLAPPVFYRQTAEIAVRLVVTRPRPTVRELFPPTVIRQRPVETLIRVHVVTTRPRPTVRLLSPPTDVRRAPVETTLAVSLVRTRPRPTRARLALPAALRVFTGPRVSLTRTRPRPTTALLAAPSAILVPAVEQARRTITVALVQTRPRPTTRLLPLVVLAAPEVTQLRVTLVAARPRPTHSRLRPPAVVRIVPPTLAQQTIGVTLAVAARVGLLYLRVKSTLPPSPVPPIINRFGWTDGYTTATDGTAGVQEPLTATTGDQEPTASAQSDVSPVAESTGMTEALYFTDGEIEIGGS